ncbi:MAG: peroxiredoxin [Burkholderiaceae bacterium]
MKNLNSLPANLPVPVDDGGAAHLPGITMPRISLFPTSGGLVELSSVPGRLVLYFYPMTGRPDRPLPNGWDQIPGARGCTPQSCAFKDHYAELQELGTEVFGVSTQSTEYQQEAVNRLHLPFALLSDEHLALTRALSLPTFVVDGKTLIKRLTLIIEDGKIVKVFYPVFPSDRNAGDVVQWLKENRCGALSDPDASH